MNVLQKQLWVVMPYARRYGRVLIGDTERSDLLLAQATFTILKQTPAIGLLTPASVIFPLLLIQFHKQIDTQPDNAHFLNTIDTHSPEIDDGEVLYEKIDCAIGALPELHRRVYLLITVAQLKLNVVSRVISEPTDRVSEIFAIAHESMTDYFSSETLKQVA